MPDLSDERPERWWVLDPFNHLGVARMSCGECGVALPRDVSIPMYTDYPVCAYHAGLKLADTPQTAEYARWISEGDPRWWSAWLCNCYYCNAQEAVT